jgi:AGZA family xanthine/uracil permease-like MFS transporter
MADAVGTTVGAMLGTSTVTTFVESASGVSEGGRTGLTSLTTAVLFLLSLFLSPIFLAIPSFATAPALIIVGFYMMGSVTEIDFKDASEGIPAFICVAAMPLFYSISEGISMGVITYVALNVITGKSKKVSPVMFVLAVLFILKYIFM